MSQITTKDELREAVQRFRGRPKAWPMTADDAIAIERIFDGLLECLDGARTRTPVFTSADGLTFTDLRLANVARLPLFRDRKGRICHKPDGSDWALSAWSNAVCGELGEAANLIKKIERGDLTLEEAREDLGRELADVVTYLDLLAYRAGVDLGDATRRKFNEVSKRVGCEVFLR